MTVAMFQRPADKARHPADSADGLGSGRRTLRFKPGQQVVEQAMVRDFQLYNIVLYKV